jgi:hypothetical protein
MSLRRFASLSAVLGIAATAGLFPPAHARAETVTGKIEKIDGASMILGGRTIALSAARTNICLKGICDQSMDKLKPGMTCSADVLERSGASEARRLACR